VQAPRKTPMPSPQQAMAIMKEHMERQQGARKEVHLRQDGQPDPTPGQVAAFALDQPESGASQRRAASMSGAGEAFVDLVSPSSPPKPQDVQRMALERQQQEFMERQKVRMASNTFASSPDPFPKSGRGSNPLDAFLRGGSSRPGNVMGRRVRESSDRPKYVVPSAISSIQTPGSTSKKDSDRDSEKDSPKGNMEADDNTLNKKESGGDKPKSKGPLRSTANCRSHCMYSRQGSSNTRRGDKSSDSNVFSPNDRMVVSWQHAGKSRPGFAPRLAIALQRYGSATNTQSIVAKRCRNNDTSGNIQFTAPKSAGVFVYRLFDDSTPETSVETLAASEPFLVFLTGSHIQSSLNIAAESLEKSGSESVGLAQLKSTLDGISVTDAMPQGSYLWENAVRTLCVCLQAVLRMVGSATADMGDEPTQGAPGEEMSEEGKSALTKYRKASRVHLDAFDALTALMNNPMVCNMVPPQILAAVKKRTSLFSDVSYRMYDDQRVFEKAMVSKFSFMPARPHEMRPQPDVMEELQAAISALLPTIMPNKEFDQERESTRARLESILRVANAIPPEATLVIFGSSRNSFGSDGADLDLSLQMKSELTTAAKEALIDAVAEALGKADMLEIEARSTARVPIVMFVDPETKLHCDISCGNPLAIRNTSLLRAYGLVDKRVRELAFVVKYWARRRQINSPQFSTLSSYGYLLCVIHFLQTRSPPLLPNLQNIPQSWKCTDTTQGFDELMVQGMVTPEMEAQRMTIGTRAPIYPYFYDPGVFGTAEVQAFASRNKQTTAELLIEFFKYFSWDFDYRASVVSICALGKTYPDMPGVSARKKVAAVPKLVKMEMDCWPPSSKLSIEDPFETWYDVGHVIRGPSMTTTRKEFVRAFTLYTRTYEPSTVDDSLPGCVDASDLLMLMCEEKEEPSRKDRSNTVTSQPEAEG